MSARVAERRSAVLAGVLVAGLVLTAVLGSWLGAPLWVRALRATLLDTALALGAALVIGVPLGFVAGSGVRLAETSLGRAVELSSALPAVVFAASLSLVTGKFYLAALALGALRSVELAWLLRGQLTIERERLHLEDQSKVRLPFAVYFTRALPLSLGPSLASAAFTPAWLSTLDAAAVSLALTPLAERVSLGTLAARGHVAAALAVVLLTVSLHVAARYFAARWHGTAEAGHEPLALALRRRTEPDPASPADE